jgi:predicted metal-dependent enzyme (double-stranded beta helix superfamily)
MNTPDPLMRFIAAVHDALGQPAAHETVSAALARLVARDDWLPPAYAQPHPEHYQQYLLHADPTGRFSIVAKPHVSVRDVRCRIHVTLLLPLLWFSKHMPAPM